MANFKVGNFLSSSSTGAQNVTGIGFQPKLVLFSGILNQDTASAVNGIAGFGAAKSSSERWAINSTMQDGQGTSDNDRRFESDECIAHQFDGAARLTADFTSMDADGFTINISTAEGTPRFEGYIAIGGDDISIDVGRFTFSTSTGDAQVTGIGFQPDLVIVGNTISNITEGIVAGAGMMFGAGVSSNSRWTFMTRGRNAQAVSVETRSMNTSGFINRFEGSQIADFVSMDADGFTYDPTTVGSAVYFGYIAISGLQIDIGTFTQSTSSGNKSTTGIGFQPEALIAGGVLLIGSNALVNSDNLMSLGYATATDERWAISSVAADGETNTDCDRRGVASHILTHQDPGPGTVLAEADLSSFDADGWTLNWTTADANLRNEMYIALATAGTSPPAAVSEVNQSFVYSSW